MFGRLKDRRRIAMRYARCAHAFFSAILIASSFLFHLNQCVLSLETRYGPSYPHPTDAFIRGGLEHGDDGFLL
jgi:hypothetical protein